MRGKNAQNIFKTVFNGVLVYCNAHSLSERLNLCKFKVENDAILYISDGARFLTSTTQKSEMSHGITEN